jgi:hypothetical protein
VGPTIAKIVNLAINAGFDKVSACHPVIATPYFCWSAYTICVALISFVISPSRVNPEHCV